MTPTLFYYNQNARSFAESTISVDFSETQNRFLTKLAPNAHILDFGCGSGRDTKYFLEKGWIYTSFKYGTFSGERNGRYFTDFTEQSFSKFAQNIENLDIMEHWLTGDVRPGRGDERWLNLLLQKK